MSAKKISISILVVILLLGGLLRFWRLGSSELAFDEGLDSFRSIGYVDFLDSAAQTTPLQWVSDNPLPWWLYLSFHDHPPLYFLIQHFSFLILGENLWAARLPSAVAGLASVFLFYFIGHRLFLRLTAIKNKKTEYFFFGFPPEEAAALGAALLAAVSMALTSTSRLAMQESVLFFFILLNIYFFLRFLENAKSWPWFGLTLGLVLLTKYTGIFLVPAYFIYLAVFNPSFLRRKELYLSSILTLFIFSPVILYNIFLYRAFGHFDLQFAYLFQQKISQWPTDLAGGKTQEPFSAIWENLRIIFSVPFMIMFLAGFGVWLRERSKQIVLFLLLLVFIILELVFTGSAIRFSSLLAVPIVFLAAGGLFFFSRTSPVLAKIFLIVFLAAAAREFWFSHDTLFLNASDYGAVKLDNYFSSVLGEYRSDYLPADKNVHLNEVIQKHGVPREINLAPTGIVYDNNLDDSFKLWLFSRRRYYQGIPTADLSSLQKDLIQKDLSAYKGFTLYITKAGPGAPLKPLGLISYSSTLDDFLENINKTNPPLVIKGLNSLPAFLVYRIKVN